MASCFLYFHVVYELDDKITHFAPMSGTAGPDVFYTALQRRLHWLVIFLLSSQYLLQGPMREAIAAIERRETLNFVQFLVTTAHSWGGISIAALMLWRWQLNKPPVPLNGGQLSARKIRWVRVHHISLYVVTICMVISGALHYYLGWSTAARWHELGKWVLFVLIFIHIAGALSHVGRGSTVLRRMMGGNSLR